MHFVLMCLMVLNVVGALWASACAFETRSYLVFEDYHQWKFVRPKSWRTMAVISGVLLVLDTGAFMAAPGIPVPAVLVVLWIAACILLLLVKHAAPDVFTIDFAAERYERESGWTKHKVSGSTADIKSVTVIKAEGEYSVLGYVCLLKVKKGPSVGADEASIRTGFFNKKQLAFVQAEALSKALNVPVIREV